MPTIEQTIAFVKKAHAGQKDKAGNDYYHHPVAVMNRLPSHADEELKLAALLHDVLEDTPYTRQHLADMGYSPRTLDIVALVTKAPGDERSYQDKISSLIASQNMDAIALKFADMSENLDPERLALLTTEKRAFFLAKYSSPFAALKAAMAS